MATRQNFWKQILNRLSGGDGHYVNRTYYPDGKLKWEGSFDKNGKPDGIGKYWDENGTLRMEQRYVNGQMESEKKWHENGVLASEDNFKNGVPHGIYRHWDEKGTLRGEVCWKEGNLDGIKRNWDEKGTLIEEGVYKEDKRTGLQRIWDGYGRQVRETSWEDDKKNGPERYWYENGVLRAELHYKDNKLDGVIRKWNMDGSKHSYSEWKNDFENGKFIKYPDLVSGIAGADELEIGYKKDGFLDGHIKAYYPDGKLKRETYVEDRKTVENKHYDKNGRLTYDLNGKLKDKPAVRPEGIKATPTVKPTPQMKAMQNIQPKKKGGLGL